MTQARGAGDRLRGLYAITPDSLCRDAARLQAAVAAALRGGAVLVQYRDKSPGADRARNAAMLLALCRDSGARFIVNDDVELAANIGADGVHLGARDAPVPFARERLGARAVIGVSCANRIERAVVAQDQGASYVAFGRFFPSRTKPDAPQADLAVLTAARASLRVPLCAIGGITPELAPQVIAAGADLVAAVEGVFGVRDVEAAARAYATQFVQ